MRIAFVYDTSYPGTKGGVEKRVWELARRLAGRGHEVHLLVPHAWDGSARIEREGVVLRGVCRSRPLYASSGRRAVWPALVHALGVLRLLRRERFDLIDCQIPAHLATLAAWSVARGRPQAKFVITWHEAWDQSWIEEMGLLGHVGRRVEALVARLPGSHTAVSAHTAETLAGLGRKAEAVIPPGVEPTAVEVSPRGGAYSDILFVGRLVPTKNLGLLIDSVAALVNSGLRPKVLVVGDGPYRELWEDQVARQGLAAMIEFAGSLETSDELVGVLRGSRVLALPSVREGYGMIALEAAAHGVPVVTVNHPRNAARHLVQHGVTGLCVPPTTAEFSAALQAVLEDDGLRDRLGEAARQSAGAVTWDVAVDDTEAMYQARVA